MTRYGGDEFAVILPSVNKGQAERAVQRLKNEVNDKTFPCEGLDLNISFSISTGIAQYEASLKNENELFESADEAMYEDKRTRKGGGENA